VQNKNQTPSFRANWNSIKIPGNPNKNHGNPNKNFYSFIWISGIRQKKQKSFCLDFRVFSLDFLNIPPFHTMMHITRHYGKYIDLKVG
jgi:hypothetical protein